jgi:ankyrin repeat protein
MLSFRLNRPLGPVAAAACALLLCLVPAASQAQSLPHEFDDLGAPAPKPGKGANPTPWQWARLTPNAQGMDPLLPAGVDAALLQAATKGQWAQALKLVRQQQANPNVQDEWHTSPLALAARAGQEELVRELLLHGANPNVTGADGYTPLGAAAQSGQAGVVRSLLKAGARRDAPGATGQSPLHLACAAGRLTVIDALLRAGADPALPNTHGQHGLDVAAYHGQAAALQRLVAAGLPLSTPDERGLNALHAAALGRQVELAGWLQQQGVSSPGALTDLLLAKMQEPWPLD